MHVQVTGATAPCAVVSSHASLLMSQPCPSTSPRQPKMQGGLCFNSVGACISRVMTQIIDLVLHLCAKYTATSQQACSGCAGGAAEVVYARKQ